MRSAVIIYVNASNNGNLSIEGLKAIASYSGKMYDKKIKKQLPEVIAFLKEVF